MDLATVRTLDDRELRQELRAALEELTDTCGDLVSHEERERLICEVMDETLGLGPLDALTRDPTVTDILINGPGSCMWNDGVDSNGPASPSMMNSI